VIEKQYEKTFEETAAGRDELPKFKAYLEAVGADPSLNEKEKWCGCRPFGLVPAGEKPKRMEKDHPKTGSEPNNVRLCSLMFAYVRFFGKKIVEAPPRLFPRNDGATDRRYSRKRGCQGGGGLPGGWREARYCQFPHDGPWHCFAF